MSDPGQCAPMGQAPAGAITIPPEVVNAALESIGKFFQPICGVDPESNVKDFLDASKSFKRAEILSRYAPLESRRLLEIGSGFGTNLAVWIKHFHVDGYGAEPGSLGFNGGYHASKILFQANGIDPGRVVDAFGEELPFPDRSFDIVYSANVLEHTRDPERVFAEAVRVLRPGGVLHMELPNYLSYFEGHYMVLQPPIVWKPILPFWVRFVFRRDPAFARTLQTQINPLWCRRMVKKLGRSHRLELVSDGSELFLENLSRPFQFEMQSVRSRLGRVLALVQKLNRGNWMGRLIVAAQGYYPIYLTVRKTA
ncbi:MAG: class I SAM-dependent methyltransferase [Acidobacteriia bacterium]|nr:class I SAM-dependent methyltransferase [Terriglobia bacterium]